MIGRIVSVDEFIVAGETAGGKNNSRSIILNRMAVVIHNHAGHVACFIGYEFGGRRINLNCRTSGDCLLLKHLGKSVSSVKHSRPHDMIAHHRIIVDKLHATVHELFNHLGAAFVHGASEGGSIGCIRRFRILIFLHILFNRITNNTILTLNAGISSLYTAAGENHIASDIRQLLNQENLSAFFRSSGRSHQACRPAANNDHVIDFIRNSKISLSRISRRCYFQRFCIDTGVCQGCFNRINNSYRCNGSARDGINSQRLVFYDCCGNGGQRSIRNTGGFLVRGNSD